MCELLAMSARITAVTQQVALVASVPLTAEAWRPLAEGEVIVLREGRVILSSHLSLEPRSQPVEHAG